MSVTGGYPLLIATVAVAALLSGCGQPKRAASPQRTPTMDVSIVVTVEYYDPEETAEGEEAPVMAEAPGGGQTPTGLETPAAGESPVNVDIPPTVETPAMAEAPADPAPEDDAGVALGDKTYVTTETRVAAVTRVVVTLPAAMDRPDFGERNRVFFVFDSAAVQDDQQAMIREWVDWLKAHPGWALRIEGHTDRQGPCLYNRWLGQQRANAARDILVEQGIDTNRLLAVSFGEDRPIIPGASRAERSRNRRVRAEPMRLADLENYDPDLPPCSSTIMAQSEPSEAVAAIAEPVLAAGAGDLSRPGLAENRCAKRDIQR